MLQIRRSDCAGNENIEEAKARKPVPPGNHGGGKRAKKGGGRGKSKQDVVMGKEAEKRVGVGKGCAADCVGRCGRRQTLGQNFKVIPP